MSKLLPLVVSGLSVLAACGDDDGGRIQCGEGTMLVDGECLPVADDQPDAGAGDQPDAAVDQAAPITSITPEGARTRIGPAVVALSSNEIATIYYTTDGSAPDTSSDSATTVVLLSDFAATGGELRYFAVDLAGNVETAKTATFDVDAAGPAAVTALGATRVGPDVDLAWTNPADADLEGILVARGVVSAPMGAPVDGQFYLAGDPLVGGGTVVSIGTAAAASDVLDLVGEYTYDVYAFDDLGNYSIVNRRAVVLGGVMATQTGTLSIDLTTSAVTITQPTGVTLSATASYDDGADQLSIELRVANEAFRPLYNLKALSTAINEGSQAGAALDGTPMTYFGTRPLAAGATTAPATLVLDGVTGGTDPIVIDLDLIESPMLMSRDDVQDVSGVNPGSTDTDIDGGFFTAIDRSGRVIASARKNSTELSLDDPSFGIGATQGRETAAILLSDQEGSIPALAFAPDSSTLYLGLNEGAHWYGARDSGGSAVTSVASLVAFDVDQLTPIAITTLADDTDGPVIRVVSPSPSGDRIAAVVSRRDGFSNQLFVVDAATLEPLDTDPVTAGVQPSIELGVGGMAEHAAWSPDGATLYVGSNRARRGDGGTAPIDVIAMADFTVSQITPTQAGDASGGLLATATKLYYSSRRGGAVALTVFDLTQDPPVESFPDVGFTGNGGGIVMDPSGERYYVADNRNGNSDVAIMSVADDTRIDADGDGGNGVTNLDLNNSPHSLMIFPQ